MSTPQLIFSILQVILSLFLIVVVLFQSSKRSGLSGAIGGAGETFFGKNRAKTFESKLVRATVWGGVALAVCTILLNIV